MTAADREAHMACRPEVTGRRPQRTARTLAKKAQAAHKDEEDEDGAAKKAKPPVARAVYSVSEFCEAHNISRDFFYELLRLHLGPACIILKKRRLISFE